MDVAIALFGLAFFLMWARSLSLREERRIQMRKRRYAATARRLKDYNGS